MAGYIKRAALRAEEHNRPMQTFKSGGELTVDSMKVTETALLERALAEHRTGAKYANSKWYDKVGRFVLPDYPYVKRIVEFNEDPRKIVHLSEQADSPFCDALKWDKGRLDPEAEAALTEAIADTGDKLKKTRKELLRVYGWEVSVNEPLKVGDFRVREVAGRLEGLEPDHRFAGVARESEKAMDVLDGQLERVRGGKRPREECHSYYPSLPTATRCRSRSVPRKSGRSSGRIEFPPRLGFDGAMALLESKKLELGMIAPDFDLPSTDGKSYRISSFSDAKALVVIFMCNHCPYVVAVQGRIAALAKEYQARGVRLVGINPNDSVKYPDDSFDAMKGRAKEQGYVFPYLRDESQDVARAYDAVCTPDIYAFENAGSNAGRFLLRYHGRLDDSWKDPAAVKRRELALALDAILAGMPVPQEQIPSMGCSIKWLQQ